MTNIGWYYFPTGPQFNFLVTEHHHILANIKLYTVSHKKRSILFSTINLGFLEQMVSFLYEQKQETLPFTY